MKETLQHSNAPTHEQLLAAAHSVVHENIPSLAKEQGETAQRQIEYADWTSSTGDEIPFISTNVKLKDSDPRHFLKISVLRTIVGHKDNNHIFSRESTSYEFSVMERNIQAGCDSIVETHKLTPSQEGVRKLDDAKRSKIGELLLNATSKSKKTIHPIKKQPEFYPQERIKASAKRFVKGTPETANKADSLA